MWLHGVGDREEGGFDAVELKKKLALNLPDYMVPAHFVASLKFR